jgi:HlyD family secretion protein
MRNNRWIAIVIVVVLAIGGYFTWQKFENPGLPSDLASGNGRLEATEIDISTKTAGRIRDILVNEGELVKAGQMLARMDTQQLEAQRRQAQAELQRAAIGVDTAGSLVKQREAERIAADAVVAQRNVELDAARIKLARSEQLARANTISQQILDDDRAAAQGARAAVAAAQAQFAASEAAVASAQAQVIDAKAAVDAARAAIESIESDIDDSLLLAPRDGRIQYRVAQPGEVLSAGGAF